MSTSHSYPRSAAAWNPATSSAMVVSTWFHGSQCPPGNHEIIPVSSCNDVIHSAVSTTSSADNTPSMSGSCGMTRGLSGVDDVALAEHWRSRALDDLHAARLLGDLPLQQSLVGLHQPVVVASNTDRALQPPVRRMQGMGVMAAGDRQAGAAQFGLQLGCGVDAHVPAHALGGVVLVAEHPVDLLWEPRRDRCCERASWFQHPHEFLDRSGI